MCRDTMLLKAEALLCTTALTAGQRDASRGQLLLLLDVLLPSKVTALIAEEECGTKKKNKNIHRRS